MTQIRLKNPEDCSTCIWSAEAVFLNMILFRAILGQSAKSPEWGKECRWVWVWGDNRQADEDIGLDEETFREVGVEGEFTKGEGEFTKGEATKGDTEETFRGARGEEGTIIGRELISDKWSINLSINRSMSVHYMKATDQCTSQHIIVMWLGLGSSVRIE